MENDLERARRDREAFRVLVMLLLTMFFVGTIVFGA